MDFEFAAPTVRHTCRRQTERNTFAAVHTGSVDDCQLRNLSALPRMRQEVPAALKRPGGESSSLEHPLLRNEA